MALPSPPFIYFPNHPNEKRKFVLSEELSRQFQACGLDPQYHENGRAVRHVLTSYELGQTTLTPEQYKLLVRIDHLDPDHTPKKQR